MTNDFATELAAIKPSSLKISATRREQLLATYLQAFDNFATTAQEVADAHFDGNRSRAATALRTLDEVNLVTSTDVNESAQGSMRRGKFDSLAWQCWDTYDYITREQAIAKFDRTFPTNTNNTGATTMSKPSTSTPATDKPSAGPADMGGSGSVGSKPSASKPAASKPSTRKSSAKKSAAKKPAARKPAAKSKETNVTATATPETKPAPTLERLFEYLRDSATTEFDGERELRPYVNSNGKLFIHSSDWIDWLTNHGTPFAKTEAAQPLRELGLVVRATPIPGKDYAKGFYQGALPTKVKDLPRRESRRAAAGTPRATRNPFAKLPAEQLSYLRNLVTKDTRKVKDDVEAARTAVLAQLDAAAGENA